MEPARAPARIRDNLSRYMHEIGAVPMLSAETELALCQRWRDRHDMSAAHRLVRSHLRLAVKIARGYRGYGLPLEDLIGEGQLGLMRAVCRFDPNRGVRFSTYAVWWVHAAIREYVLHNWSLVKIGTTAAQKKLFFNLRRARHRLRILDNGTMTSEHASLISAVLQVSQADVISMDQRLSGPDLSLNAPARGDGQDEWQAFLVDERDGQESQLADDEEKEQKMSLLSSALGALTTRERHIIAERHLTDTPTTLVALSHHYGLSKERVRQIELRAMDKLQRAMRPQAA